MTKLMLWHEAIYSIKVFLRKLNIQDLHRTQSKKFQTKIIFLFPKNHIFFPKSNAHPHFVVRYFLRSLVGSCSVKQRKNNHVLLRKKVNIQF